MVMVMVMMMFETHHRILKLIKIGNNRNFKYFYHFNFLSYSLTLVIVSLMFLEFIRNLFDPHVNLITLSEQLEVMFLSLAVSIKTLLLMLKTREIEYFVRFVDEHSNKLDERTQKTCRKVCKGFCLLVVVTITVYSLKPFLVDANRNHKQIYQLFYPFEFNWISYSILLFYEMLGGLFGAFILAFWDTYVLNLMIFVSGQYLWIENQMVDLHTNNYRLIDIIEHHKRLNKFSDTLNNFMNPVMTVYLFTSSIMVCCAGFQLTILGVSLKSCFLFEYIIALLGQSFLFYWFSNDISFNSMKLHTATWKSQWYTFPVSEQRNILMLRNFWLRPKVFYVGPFNKMTLQTFLAILQASYSYLMVLNRLQQN